MAQPRIELATMNHHYMFYDLDDFLPMHKSSAIPASSYGHLPSTSLWIIGRTIPLSA